MDRDRIRHGPVRVVVRFGKGFEVPAGQDAVDCLPEGMREGWDAIVRDLPGLRLRSLFQSIPYAELDALVACALARDPAFVAPDLSAYFSVTPAAEGDLNELRRRLETWPAVRHHYVSRPAPNPSPTPDDDPDSPLQGYLEAEPKGIDARFAWTIVGGDGAGQRFVDVERGWLLEHEDLDANVSDSPIHGEVSGEHEDVKHGTRVLGVVCAVDNEVGGIGIAPKLAAADVSAYDGATYSREAAIARAAYHLSTHPERGVLLIEAQTWSDDQENMLAPVEVDDADYDVIRTAVSCGVVVVEAGGNGRDSGSGPAYLDMDTYERDGKRILSADPTAVGYRDSGALIVSAADPETHRPRSYAPRGGRVDCWAWGKGVRTTTATLLGDENRYTSDFSATSSASAIIAGAALCLLGIARSHQVEPMEAEDVREILRDPTTGTPARGESETDDPPPIGVMPDLRAIVGALQPDLVVRDLVPPPPPRSRQFASPDVFVRSSRSVDPQAEFGAGSPAEDATNLSEPIMPGRRHYVYVRVSNQGGWSAPDVTVSAHWAPAATLLMPSSWRPIGSAVLSEVPSGDVLTVAEIPWEADHLPRGVPYGLIAEVDTELDPSPVGPGGWETFFHRILPSDNVAWDGRQTLVVPWLGGTVTGAFLAHGASDRAITTRLEVEAHLPWNAHAALVTPALRPFVPFTGPPMLPRRPGEMVRFAILRQGVTTFDEVEVPAGAQIPLVLEVSMPWPALARNYRVIARQRVGSRVVGQVTWRLVQGPHP